MNPCAYSSVHFAKSAARAGRRGSTWQWRDGVSPPQSVTSDSDDQSAPPVPPRGHNGRHGRQRWRQGGARTGTERIRKLAQAALNADVTVDQVDTILEGLAETLHDLNNSTGNLDATLERFNETISHINELAPRLNAMVDRLEAIVDRVERIVGIGEARSRRWRRPNPLCAVRSTAVRRTTGSSAGQPSGSAPRSPRAPGCRGTCPSTTRSPRSPRPAPGTATRSSCTAAATTTCSPSPPSASSRSTRCPRRWRARVSPTI